MYVLLAVSHLLLIMCVDIDIIAVLGVCCSVVGMFVVVVCLLCVMCHVCLAVS